MELKNIIEAILFAADKPMSVKHLQNVFPELEQPDLIDIQSAINEIIEDYSSKGVQLKQVASGYRFQVNVNYSYWVSRLFEEKPPRYSRALLETLAIIAYRQPVTRGDIEAIRGVAVSTHFIRTLQERDWIRIVAHKEVPGRPALYGTTKHFLDYFNLSSLHELPALNEIIASNDWQNVIDQQPTQADSEEQEYQIQQTDVEAVDDEEPDTSNGKVFETA